VTKQHSQRPVVVCATVPSSVRTLLAPQIARLADRGHRVEVVTSPGDDALAELPGVDRVHLLPMSREISPLADLVALVAWVRLLLRVRPSTVIAFSPKASLLGLIAARLTGVRHRVYSTGGLRLETATGPARWLLWLTEWITCASATRVVANSPSLARVYEAARLGRGKTAWTLSRKGVDHRRFDPAQPVEPLEVAGPADLPVVGFVGRVTRDKGVAVLADALAMLRNEGVVLRALVVGPGEGSDADQLLADLHASTLHLTAPGSVSDPRPAYAAMDVFVLPSAREGFPNVVIEAGAMGLPAIVSDATGCIDSVDEASGLTFAAGDAAALAAAIRRLVEDDALRQGMGDAARDRAVAQFDPDRVIDHQLDLMGMGALPCAASRDT
jgi:glycosyltransferase involved in cell wall biosynthesis